MKRYAVITLKIVASFPLALLVGGLAASWIQQGLWPLLFFPDRWLHVIDIVTTLTAQGVMLGGLIWFWALGR